MSDIFKGMSILTACALGLSVAAAYAQSSLPSFEAVSIRRDITGRGPNVSPVGAAGDRFVTTGSNLLFILQFAYQRSDGGKLRYSDIIGAPEWANSDAFDIQARAGHTPSPEEMRRMVQSLLGDRFQLKAHLEKRELPVYELLLAKDGPRLKPADLQLPGKQQLIGMPSPAGGLTLKMRNTQTSLANLSNTLQSYAGRPIIDKTGLEGQFDISLQFALETLSTGAVAGTPSPADPSGASLFTAIQEQLGLKLESSKGPVEVLVIDSVQKPSEN
jgi:uncharacterized protein (TIGR03435 family)